MLEGHRGPLAVCDFMYQEEKMHRHQSGMISTAPLATQRSNSARGSSTVLSKSAGSTENRGLTPLVVGSIAESLIVG